jgi:hypothetical protein
MSLSVELLAALTTEPRLIAPIETRIGPMLLTKLDFAQLRTPLGTTLISVVEALHDKPIARSYS